MSKALREVKPVDYSAKWQRAILNRVVRPPIPRMKTTSTGAPIREGAVLVGPMDMCPEG